MGTPWSELRSEPGLHRALQEAQTTAAGDVVTLFAELDLSRSAERRVARTDAASDPTTITYDDVFVHVTALALRQHPQLLAGAVGTVTVPGGATDGTPVNIGVVDLGPRRQRETVIARADTKTLSQIAAETSLHAERLWRDEQEPAAVPVTFTIANLGMWGIERFTGALRQGQRAMLTVGQVRPKPVCSTGGRIEARPMVSVGVTADNHLLDPIEAACFLETLQLRLGDPRIHGVVSAEPLSIQSVVAGGSRP